MASIITTKDCEFGIIDGEEMKSILKPSIFSMVDKKNRYFERWLKENCTNDEIFRISAYFEKIYFDKNKYVFLEGSLFDKIYIIEFGELIVEKKINRFSNNELFKKKKNEDLFCNNSKDFSKLTQGILIYGKNAILGIKEFNEERKNYYFSGKTLKKTSLFCISKKNLKKILNEFPSFKNVFDNNEKKILEKLNKKFEKSCFWKSISFQKFENINQRNILNNFIKIEENKNIKKISKLFNNFNNFHTNFINKQQIYFKRKKKSKKLCFSNKIKQKNHEEIYKKRFSKRIKNSAVNILNPLINKIYNKNNKLSRKNFSSSQRKNFITKNKNDFLVKNHFSNSEKKHSLNFSQKNFLISEKKHYHISEKKIFFDKKRKSHSTLNRYHSNFIPKGRLNLYKFKVKKFKVRHKRINSSFVKKILI